MRPYQTFRVLENLRINYSGPLYRGGVRLSADDTETALKIYQQWLCLFVDLEYLSPLELERTARRLWLDITKVDVLVLNGSFAEALHSIRVQQPKGFKALCSTVSPHLYSIIRADWERVLRSDVFAARKLVQLFSYTSRLTLNDIDLSQQLLDQYRSDEARLSSSYDPGLIRDLNKIMRRWIGPYAPDTLYPKHGPGGVAGHGRTAIETKYKDLCSDQLLAYAQDTSRYELSGIQSSLDRISQTIFVPKSYKTFRTISMEPTSLMFYQQGVWNAIERRVASYSFLRARIGFRDQSRNRNLAQEGSLSRNYATIDLSSASDSVSNILVKQVFRGTWLLRHLVALRSKKTLLPDGSLITLKKFAPMGSALSFPVETLIFAAVCENVARKHRRHQLYSVFGDDIIVPTEWVEEVITSLESLDFLVNREKSFYHKDCWFRESCGGEYCDGFDVSPLRVSRKYSSKDNVVKTEQLIALANGAFNKGFRVLRYCFIDELQKSQSKVLFAPTSLLSDNYTNFHLKDRWNARYQRLEVKSTILKTKVNGKPSPLTEEIRYQHWLVSTDGRKTLGDGFESVVSRSMVVLSEAWREKPYSSSEQPRIDFETTKIIQ